MCLSLTGNHLLMHMVELSTFCYNRTCYLYSHDSTRKRQSVVCRYPDGRLLLYCKVIISRVLPTVKQVIYLAKMTALKDLAFHRVLIM
jgi:magnesium-transporting ATPase (P-type)